MIVHKSMIDGTGTKPIGAGPFQFESYTREQIVKMTKNPKYYNAKEILLAGLDIVNVDLGPAGDHGAAFRGHRLHHHRRRDHQAARAGTRSSAPAACRATRTTTCTCVSTDRWRTSSSGRR